MLKRIALLWLAAFALSGAAFSQEYRAIISGTVTDPQGAVVPGAKIVVKNLATNVGTTVETSGSGLYSVPPLNPGQYLISVSAAGFKTSVRTNIELRVTDRIQLDFKLELGATADTVTVTAETPLIETASASQGTIMSKQSVADLPLLGRNPFILATYTAGVIRPSGLRSGSDRPFDNGGMDNYQVNGAAGGVNEYLLDGSPNTNRETTQPSNLSFVPPPDAVSEFKMLTNNYDAEFGRTGGGVISLSLKNGTNDYHGSVYWYFRNDKLNANSFQTNRIPLADSTAKAQRAAFRWAEPGAQFQGPVVIPKIYNGRDRTFFMYNLELIRSSVPRPSSMVVPTAAELQGDFSKTYVSGTGGNAITLYDPLTTVLVSGTTYKRTAFPNSAIPDARINPVARALTKYYPPPNITGVARGISNLVSTPNATTDKYNAHTVRIDQNLTAKNKFFVTFVRGNRHEDGGLGGGLQEWNKLGHPEAAPTYLHWRVNHGATVNFTSLLSPTFVSTVRASFNRHQFAIAPYGNDWDPTVLGFPSSVVGAVQRKTFPNISPGGYQSLAGGYGGSTILNFSNTWSVGETLSKVISSHALKFGGEARAMFNNQSSMPQFASISFSDGFTRANPLQSDTASGNGFASFLLGYPSSGSTTYNNWPAQGQRYYVVFFQDDWRAADKLTLNFGLRWDYESPITDRFNRYNVGFDTSTMTTLPGSSVQVKGGLVFGDANHRFAYKRDLNNIQPRVGLAYRISAKQVLRGGWGISYLPTAEVPPTAGFTQSTPIVTSLDGSLTPALLPGGLGRLSNPFPEGINLPAGASLGLRTYLGQGISYIYPGRVVPYVHSLSFGFQRELPFRAMVDVSYSGSRTRALGTSKAINDVSYGQYMQNGSTLTTTQVTNPYAGLLTGTSLNSATYSLQQSLRPYTQYTGITENGRPIGTTRYDSLQIRGEKRLSLGLQFLVTYTRSYQTTHNGYLNGGQDAIGQFITQLTGQPHVVNVSATYELPFFGGSPGLKKTLLGGWTLSGIFNYQSGTLFNVGGATSTGLDPRLPNPTRQHFFNTCTFNASTNLRSTCASDTEPVAWIIQKPYTLLTVPNPQFLRNDRPPNFDFSVFKSFAITERVKMEFRAESFNLTNTPLFGNANTTPTSNNFGVVADSQNNDPRNVQLALRLTF